MIARLTAFNAIISEHILLAFIEHFVQYEHSQWCASKTENTLCRGGRLGHFRVHFFFWKSVDDVETWSIIRLH